MGAIAIRLEDITSNKRLLVAKGLSQNVDLFWLPTQSEILHFRVSDSLLGARTLLGAPGIATRSKDATGRLVAPDSFT